ncbi:MAG: helix-turn-helix domain-containing protein [Egibacteraceae bacterium]
MSAKVNPSSPLQRPEVRRAYEEELLFGTATVTIEAMLESVGVTRGQLASRLGVSPSRISQILSGKENLTLRSLAALGWALGIRFELHPIPMADRVGTPAVSDSNPPEWLMRAGRRPEPDTTSAEVNQHPSCEPTAKGAQ